VINTYKEQGNMLRVSALGTAIKLEFSGLAYGIPLILRGRRE
jgi:hypothetical protein